MIRSFAGLQPVLKAETPYCVLSEIYAASRAVDRTFRPLEAAAASAGRSSWKDLVGPRERRSTDWLVLGETELDLRPRWGGRARSAAEAFSVELEGLPVEARAELVDECLPDPDECEGVWAYVIPAHVDQRVVMLDLIERLFIKRTTTAGGVMRLEDGRMIVVARWGKRWRSRSQLEETWHDDGDWRGSKFVCSRRAAVLDEATFAALFCMMRETPPALRKFAPRWETAVYGFGREGPPESLATAIKGAHDRRQCLIWNAANGWDHPPPPTGLTMADAQAIARFIDDHAGPKDRAEGRRLAWAFMGLQPWGMSRSDLDWWNGTNRSRERPSTAELNRFDGLRDYFPVRRSIF